MAVTREQIVFVLRWLKSKGLLDKLVLVGDAAVCMHGLPCYAEDVDFSAVVSLKPAIERMVPVLSVEERREYPGYGPGYVIHSRIGEVAVDFNLEPPELWEMRYSGSIVIKRFSGIDVRVYTLERYVAGKLRRLALMKAKRAWQRAPREIMDLVPVYKAGISHSKVRYWVRRIHAFDFCPDREAVEEGVELARKLMGVSYSAERLYRELSADSGCLWASSCALKCRDRECRRHLGEVDSIMGNIPWKPMGGILLEMHGYRVYMRDLDVGLLSREHVELLRHRCYGFPNCRVFVEDVRLSPDVLLGCCWLDTVVLPSRLWRLADTLEFYLASNFAKVIRNPHDDYMVSKVLAKFAALYLQGFFEHVNSNGVRKVAREIVSTGYISALKPIRPTRSQVLSAAAMFFYVYLPPANLIHFDFGIFGRLVEKAVSAANRVVLGDRLEHG